MKTVDIREGYDAIDFAINHVHTSDEPWEMWNSDDVGLPAPRVILISKALWDELQDFKFRYESVSK